MIFWYAGRPWKSSQIDRSTLFEYKRQLHLVKALVKAIDAHVPTLLLLVTCDDDELRDLPGSWLPWTAPQGPCLGAL